MGYLLSIDPGLRACGVALWNGGILEHASFVKNGGATWASMVNAVDDTLHAKMLLMELAVELPQVYVRSKSKGDPNDLIQLAGLVGAFTYRYNSAGVTLYKPRDWKGQTDKDVTEFRARKRLSEDEITRIELPKAKTLAHNVFDAIGIGLHHLKR